MQTILGYLLLINEETSVLCQSIIRSVINLLTAIRLAGIYKSFVHYNSFIKSSIDPNNNFGFLVMLFSVRLFIVSTLFTLQLH